MAKQSNQKRKLLALKDILMKYTDSNHSLSVNELIEKLSAYGISAERKSIYDDMEQLRLHGLDICCEKEGNVNFYSLGEREFQLVELKLLVDAVQSSKFITEKKSSELIGKLESLSSEYEASQLHRQVYVSNRVKTPNEKIYYAVDVIHKAITDDRQISFVYNEWSLSTSGAAKIEKRAKHDGAIYKVSPWMLAWDDENYYLIAFDLSSKSIRHYRVDKMEKVCESEENRLGKDAFAGLDMATYSKSVFGMYGGEIVEVKIRAHNSLVGVVADRFGKDIFVSRDGENYFVFTINVALSPQFFAWLFGLGEKAKLVAPASAAERFSQYVDSVKSLY